MPKAILRIALCRAIACALLAAPVAAQTTSGGVTAANISSPAQRNAQRRTPARSPSPAPQRRPDVIYYPTPPETVAEMLRLANIREGDVLYDLGSGDGRIPIMAAQRYGIRAIGIEITPALITEAQERARAANVAHLVEFRNEDMFRTDLRRATVVTLYLSNRLNMLLRPKLLRELRPGARIVSHDFRMGDWPPEQTVRVPWMGGFRTVRVWTVPPRGRARRRR